MEIENRRKLFIGLSTATLLALAGCEREPKPASSATLTNNNGVHLAMQELISAVQGLEGDVERFDSENWREVVPDIKTATSGVASAVMQLRTALGYSDAN
jgi:hypothetical protein